MFMKKLILGAVLATACFAGAASAAPVYAVAVVSNNQNATPVPVDRSNPNAVMGPADGIFYSLGLGGNLVLDFGPDMVTSPGFVSEVTFKLAHYIESMQVFVSKTLTFSNPSVATVTNQTAGLPGGATFSFNTSSFRYVKLVDTSPVFAGRDGFDVDTISFSPLPVPVPAAGLLLGGALFGFGALRRRGQKTA
jgi:hypothetical protein